MTISPLRISDAQIDRAQEELTQLVALAPISNKKRTEQLDMASKSIEEKLRELDFDVAPVSIEESPPFLLGEHRVHIPDKPTILLYGHYDVQPVDRERWTKEPFQVKEEAGRLYGRGASDDLAGIMGILAALREYKAQGRAFPVNIKILFEGEEEVGSPHMGSLIKEQAMRLEAEAVVILDGMNRDVETGTLTSMTRGFIGLQLKIKALEKPVHSGIGVLAPDPAAALVSLVGPLVSDPRRIPGIMDGFQELGEEERKAFRDASEAVDTYKKKNGVLVGELQGNPETSVYERLIETPTISIVNMGAGVKDGPYSIQSEAFCTLNIRTLRGQDPDHIAKKVIEYMRSQKILGALPLEIEQDGDNNWAWQADVSKPITQKYMSALKESFPKCAFMPSCGTLPLLRDFTERFPGIEMIIPAVEDPATAAHSHDESQDIRVWRCAINALLSFLHKAGNG